MKYCPSSDTRSTFQLVRCFCGALYINFPRSRKDLWYVRTEYIERHQREDHQSQPACHIRSLHESSLERRA